jgi:hypothetical protein
MRLFGAAPLIALLVPLVAWADDPAPSAVCHVRIVHALKDGNGIDPRITRMRPYLERPQFAEWHQFKLLEDKELKLPANGTADFTLPNGRKGTLTYVDHFIADKEHRLRIKLTLDRPDKRMLDTTFVLDEDGLVLQGGQKHDNGRLILGISCKTEK